MTASADQLPPDPNGKSVPLRNPWGREVKIAIVSVLCPSLIGFLTLGFMWRSDETAQKALQVQRDQYATEKESAERQRDAAKKEVERYQRVIADAPTTFIKSLEALINQASAEVEQKATSQRLQAAAQALVSARNSLRSDLETIQSRLDGDVDALEPGIGGSLQPDQLRLRPDGRLHMRRIGQIGLQPAIMGFVEQPVGRAVAARISLSDSFRPCRFCHASPPM